MSDRKQQKLARRAEQRRAHDQAQGRDVFQGGQAVAAFTEPKIHSFRTVNSNLMGDQLASPLVLLAQGAGIDGGPVFWVRAIGGLTKLEHGALAIAAAMRADAYTYEHLVLDAQREAVDPDEFVATIACQQAEAVLAACKLRQEQDLKEQNEKALAEAKAKEEATLGNGEGRIIIPGS